MLLCEILATDLCGDEVHGGYQKHNSRSRVIHQDDFFKRGDQVTVGEDSFKQWQLLESPDTEAKLSTAQTWASSPGKFADAHGVSIQRAPRTSTPSFRKASCPTATHLVDCAADCTS